MKYLKEFNDSTNNDILDIKDIFQDIIDLKYDTYQFRDGDGTKYQKVFDVKFKTTKSGNIIIDVFCSYHCYYGIVNDIKKEIFPVVINIGFKPTVSVRKTDDKVLYRIPVSGKNETHPCWEPIYKISVLLKPI